MFWGGMSAALQTIWATSWSCYHQHRSLRAASEDRKRQTTVCRLLRKDPRIHLVIAASGSLRAASLCTAASSNKLCPEKNVGSSELEAAAVARRLYRRVLTSFLARPSRAACHWRRRTESVQSAVGFALHPFVRKSRGFSLPCSIQCGKFLSGQFKISS